jgi:hypothetical protein
MDPLEELPPPRLMGVAPAAPSPAVGGDEDKGTGEEAPEPLPPEKENGRGGSGLMLPAAAAEGLVGGGGCFRQSFTSAKAPRPSSLMTAYSFTPASAPISSVTMSARVVSRMANPGPGSPCCRCARCSVVGS